MYSEKPISATLEWAPAVKTLAGKLWGVGPFGLFLVEVGFSLLSWQSTGMRDHFPSWLLSLYEFRTILQTSHH